jgi:hypothetical protein
MQHRLLIVRWVLPALLLSMPLAANSQQAPALEEVTVAGCLQKGSTDGAFLLVADDKQAYQVEPTENVELTPHVDHRVELTGAVERSEATAVLKARALKMVADSCDA